MNLDTIRMFCDLVELQNFSRTAEKHYISQSAVSQQLAQLELVHKCQLINRKKRPLTATTAGELFYLACKDMLERYDKFNSELAALSQSTARVNLAAIFSIGMHTLQPYIKKFIAEYPNVHLNVDYLDAATIYERLILGEIDFGLVAVPRKDNNIEIYPFESEPLVFVCSAQHSLAKKVRLDIQIVQTQKLIAFDKAVPTRTLIDDILSRHGIVVNPVMEFDNVETIKRVVEINAGVSVMPQTTIGTEVKNGTLTAIPFTKENFVRPTGIIVRKSTVLNKYKKAFLEMLWQKVPSGT